MAQPPDIAALHSALTSALISTTRTVSELCAEDLAFHRSLDPKLGTELDKQSARLLDLAERLIRNAGAEASSAKGRPAGVVQDVKLKGEDGAVEAIDGNWSSIVDVVDGLLERADASLDEYTGVVKRGKMQQQAVEGDKAQPAAKPTASKINVLRNQDIPKPQLQFEHVPRNDEQGPFKPLITSKPHAVVPLEDSLRLQSSVDEDGHEHQHYPHPYAAEMDAYAYPASVHTTTAPIPPTDWASTTATLVDTPEALHEMLAELKTASEIAVDLEHHDYRTYIGLTSLMQISTRSKDWIVDTLQPWRRELSILNEVFTDPSILKVLHGSSMDMIWLQRDLGIYVVGLFDTYHACRALSYQRAGLDFLLQKFVNFQAQKKYQRADWRIRPLPEELFDYARSDTHFLLYIYDNMRNELIQRSTPDADLLQYVQENSKQEALQRYENPLYDAENGSGPVGWMRLLLSTPAMFSKEQFSVFKAVHAWRDSVAREEDESVFYIMPNHALFAVARNMPTNKANLFGTLQGVSLPVRLRADELVGIIAKAKEAGKDGAEMNEVLGIALGKRKRDAEASSGSAKKHQTQPPAAAAAPPATFAAPRPEDVRATKSTFWGNAFGAGGAWGSIKATAAAAGDAIRLALPLPNLTAQIFADPGEAAAAVSHADEPAEPAAVAEHAYVRPEDRKRADDEDVFIVRQLGGKKRKRNQAERLEEVEAANGDGVDADEMAVAQEAGYYDDGSAQKRKEKKERRREKKERKRLKKLQEGADASPAPANGSAGGIGLGSNEDEVMLEEQPFDYANAPSVLHASAAGERGGRKGKGKKGGGFDMYKKAMDAPKGLSKRQKSGAGRSGTFAN